MGHLRAHGPKSVPHTLIGVGSVALGVPALCQCIHLCSKTCRLHVYT